MILGVPCLPMLILILRGLLNELGLVQGNSKWAWVSATDLSLQVL
ncbi:hypothetical protein glysoja_044820 [Glycine soja]|uniref:Uncharacterized protein n=1 Tax=Glycine soja TaxID=3848 RepID=A0A0B2P2Z5_GLYSO|nr:hypothetical protein glysoja_044820 [Glycine soja]